MHSNDTRSSGRRQQRGGRRRHNDQRRDFRGPREERTSPPAPKLTLWQKLIAFFTGGGKKTQSSPTRSDHPRPAAREEGRPGRSERRLPEPIEVTSPKLYVGNLSYDATESDLFDLFKGAGQVQNAEVVTQKGTYQSKGFGFVTMLTVEEAKRAAETLHDQPFMGRKLVVTGSKSIGPRDA